MEELSGSISRLPLVPCHFMFSGTNGENIGRSLPPHSTRTKGSKKIPPIHGIKEGQAGEQLGFLPDTSAQPLMVFK